MFSRIIEWIKRVIGMLTSNDVRTVIGVDVAISAEMSEAISIWSEMYHGRANWIDAKTKSLNLPSAIAAELAMLATIEMKSEVAGSARADYINTVYQPIIDGLRRYVEYGCAKGGLILKPYVEGNEIKVDFIQADCFLPIAFDSSGRITGAVFIDQIKRKNKVYTRLECHSMVNAQCIIKNLAFSSDNDASLGSAISLTSVDEWQTLQPEAIINNVNRPLFGYFKVPKANTIDTRSPLGVSVYSRAVDLIQEADKQYSRFLWEFESGERALFVSDGAFKRDKEGKPILPNKRLYKTLNVDDNNLFEDWTPTLREAELIKGLDKILQRIEFNCGLAYGTLSDAQSVDKTAEEIRASKQRSYATVSDTQKAIRSALEALVEIIDIYCTLYKLAPMGKYEVSFEFDDSIISDANAEFVQKQALVSLGIMQQYEFRMWYFGEDENTARKMVAQPSDLLGG